MTVDELQAIAAELRLRQTAVVVGVKQAGGMYDPILRRFVEWNQDGPIEERNERHWHT